MDARVSDLPGGNAPPTPDADEAATDGDAPMLSAMLWTMTPPPGGADGAPPDAALLRPHISENEWARVATFRDPFHAWSSAATRALLRAMLSRYHGADPMAWHFLTEPGGRPHVDMTRLPHAVTAETRPRFSLSHTHGLAACMVSLGPWPDGAELGVDAEWRHRPALSAGRLARRFFHPDEFAAVSARPQGPARHDLFLTLWTRKEAVLKALGLGIANHLACYACTGEPARVTGDPAMIGAGRDWHLESGDPTPDHRLSWAIRLDPGQGAATEDESASPGVVVRHRHLAGWNAPP
ncbi:4'-phosphopantetheinyl transferase family protein [Roseospira navarrensis]|uniref:4'-phosphopantetheinyl transferase superfamily protein n=1 Tax=Roseospira navarrensis TaxID=140058 RepID=A0A7X1ZH73_9PROT|nr:4'-phosphopantetheinyl transferase superfamily protein [Roseospira navarrensis]MQX38405.1 4'-phosphopantetheinyl transferase superfamily protein [Roseospira navarrensis]